MNRKKHSAFDEASERLALAFSRLEKATAHAKLVAQSTPSDDVDEGELSLKCRTLENTVISLQEEGQELREENILLSNQLQSLQKDYLDLQQVADQVAERIEKQAVQLDLIAMA